MTISNTAARKAYSGNSSTTAFAFPYRVLDEDDVTVYVDDDVQVNDTDYTVSGVGSDSGVTVTFVTAPATGTTVVVINDPDVTQEVDYTANDRFRAETHEGALDKGTVIDIRTRDLVERSVRWPDDYAGSADPELPAPVAGGYWRWDTDGLAVEFVSGSEPGDGTFTASGTGATERTWEAKAGDIKSIRDFGALGDGTNDQPEIAASSLANLENYVPSVDGAGYKVGDPIIARTGQRWHGDGYASYLYNDDATSGGSGQVFVLGTIDDGGLTDTNAVYKALNAVTKGDDYVTCTTAAHAANYVAGDIVAIYGGTGYTAGGLYFKPTHQQINEVVSVNASTGVIELRDPMYRTTATGMKIHCARHNLGHVGNDFTPQMVGYVTIENMRLAAMNDAITRYGGIYRTTFRDVWITEATNVWSMNASAYCTLANIHAVIDNRGIEFGYFSHDNYIYNVDIVQKTGTTTAQDLGMISFAEGSHHNLCEDIRVDYHNATSERCVRFGEGSYENRVTRMKARANSLAFVIVASSAETTMDQGANVVEDSVFEIGAVSGDVITAAAATDATSVGLSIRRNIFKITTIGAVLIDIDASNVLIEDNDFSGCPADAINVDTACTNVRIINNKFPSGTALTTFAQANVFALGNTIAGRESVESMHLRAGSVTGITSTSSSNSLASQAVPAAGFAAGDELIVDIGGVLAGTDAHTIDILWDGDVICTFTTTTADEFSISGRIKLLSATAWKAVTRQTIGTAVDTVRKATTSDTAAITGDGLLNICAYVGNAASTITVDYASVRYVPRY